MPDMHAILLIITVSLTTVVIRFLPFWIFGGGRKTPQFLIYLGKVLPYAIMGMLVVFCLKSIDVLSSPHGLPELIAGLLVAGLHIWRRNTLLSIAAGTVCYMLLVQFVFI